MVKYITCFFTGVIFSNGFVHFINGISGRKFPKKSKMFKSIGTNETDFIKAGTSPVANVIWGSVNLIISFIIINIGEFIYGLTFDMLTLGLGIICGASYLAYNFNEN